MTPEEYCEHISRSRGKFIYMAYALTRNIHDAEDLVQDLCVKLHDVKTLPPVEKPDSWLGRVLRNLFIDNHRKNQRSTVESFGSEELHAFHMEGPGVYDTPATTEFYEQIILILDQMQQKHREVILLCYYEGYSVEEASDMLAIPIGTVKSRLDRGKRKLIALYEASYN